MENNSFKGMTERDLLIQLNERVYNLQNTLSDNSKRLDVLETDFLTFKTEIQVRLRTYLAIASSVATIIGYLLNLFLTNGR
jgi:uncharacterized protein YlxW (UPF0749 family)